MFVSGSFNVAVSFRVRKDVTAVDRQQVLSYFYVDAGLCQRGSQVGIPVFTAVDPCESIASVRYFEVCTEQADTDALRSGYSPSTDV